MPICPLFEHIHIIEKLVSKHKHLVKENITCSYGNLGTTNKDMCGIKENVDTRHAKFKFLSMHFWIMLYRRLKYNCCNFCCCCYCCCRHHHHHRFHHHRCRHSCCLEGDVGMTRKICHVMSILSQQMMPTSNKYMAKCLHFFMCPNKGKFCCGNKTELNNMQAEQMLSHRIWNLNCKIKIYMYVH